MYDVTFKKMGGKKWPRIVIDLMVLTILLANSASALSNSGGGNWQNYSNISLNNSGSALTDFQVMINLTSSNFPENAQSDGDDIRFTDSNGIELNYWFNDWNYPVNAHIWVNVPDVPAGTSTIRMFYGNPLASSSVDGDATFEFFDDFSGSLDTTNKWTLGYASAIAPTTSITDGVLKVTSNGVSYAALHTKYSVGTSDQIIFFSRERVLSLDKVPITTGYVDAANNNNNRFGIRENGLNDGNKYLVQTRVDGGTLTDSAVIATIAQNDWFWTEIIRESSSQFTAKMYNESGNLYGSNTSTNDNWSDNSFWRNVFVQDTSGIELDIVYARKYNYSEPDTTVGTEQSAPLNVYVDATYIDGSAGGHVFGYDAFNTIQEGINAVASEGTVYVAAGTYIEQIDINKKITLTGAGEGSTILQSPSLLVTKFVTAPNENKPIVYVNNTIDITLQHLTVNGDGLGNSNYRMEGIAFFNASGTVDHITITGIRETPLNGNQHGVALYANNADGLARTITITNNTINDFQKNGMGLSGSGLTVNVRDNTVTGSGPTSVIAQNGIQVSYGATGIVGPNNIVSDVSYTGPGWASSGILIYLSDTDILQNSVNNAQVGIYFVEGNGLIKGNTVTGTAAGTGSICSVPGTSCYWGIDVSDPPQAKFSPLDEPVQKTLIMSSSTMTVNVTDNTITGGSDSADSVGLEADAGFYGTVNVNFKASNNIISGWGNGVVVYQCDSSCTGSIFDSIAVNHNSITGNNIGMFANVISDATYNWWGSTTGPGPVGPGTGDKVSTNVIYDPWIGKGTVTGEIRHYSTQDNELTSTKVSTLSDVGKNFIIPQYGNGVSWQTRVYVTDYSGLGSTLTVQYYDQFGNPGVIETPTIPANGTISWKPTDGTNSRPLIGKMVITSTNDVTGEFILNSTINTDLISSRLYTSADIGTSFLIPSYGNGVTWNTFVAISDVSGLGTNLTLKYYDVSGNHVWTENPSIPANGMYKYIPTDGTVPQRPLIGKLEITSDRNITGEFRVYGNTGILSNKLYTSADMKKTFVIPSYGNGVSWQSWIAISDVSGFGANLTVKYYDAAGILAQTEYPNITANGTYKTILTDGTNSRPLLGKLEISSDNNVSGEMRIYPTSGRGITATGLYTTLDISNTLIVPYYGNNNDFHTYLALSDFSGNPGDVRLEYHSMGGGTPVKVETQTIPANGMNKWIQLDGIGDAPIEGNIFIYR